MKKTQRERTNRLRQIKAARRSRLQDYPDSLPLRDKAMLLAIRAEHFYSEKLLEFVPTGRSARKLLKSLRGAGLLVQHKMDNGGTQMWRYSVSPAAKDRVTKMFREMWLIQ